MIYENWIYVVCDNLCDSNRISEYNNSNRVAFSLFRVKFDAQNLNRVFDEKIK